MDSPSANAADPRAALLARRASKGDCTPVPADDCPVPGVFVARMSAARYLVYLDALRPFDDKPGDDADEKAWKSGQRLGVRLRFAAVDADGLPVFRDGDDLSGIEFEVVGGLLAQFVTENGMGEKKAPPPSGSPAASPSSAGGVTSPPS